MAENKKSFLFYADFIHTFESLNDNEAGKLIKHVLRYVNDQNPASTNKIVNIAFEPIKQQLKRDLKKYEQTCEKNLENIKKRWAKKDTKNTSGKNGIPADTKHTDTGNDNDTDNGTETVNDIGIEIKKEGVRSNVYLHRREIEKLQMQYTDVDIGWMYDKLSAYKLSKGKKYKSDYGAILSWVIDKLKEEKEKNSAKKENGKSNSKTTDTINGVNDLLNKRGINASDYISPANNG